MKSKSFKILLTITSAIAIIVLILALGISPVTKNYIEKHSKELIGRKVQMKGLHINIFTGTLELDSIYLYEKNNKDVFASIDTFFVNIELTKLLSKNLEISELKVVHPYLDVLQKGDVFNFDDLMSKKNSSKKDTAHSSFPKSIVIRNIYFRGGTLVYTDQLLKNTIKMNDLGVSIPELSFGNGNTKGGVHLKIGDIATLDSKLEINMKTDGYKLNILVKNLAVNIVKPYVQQYYNINQFEGLVSGNLLIVGNTNHIMDFKLSGTSSASGFKMTNNKNEPIVSAETASVKMNNISYKTSTYLFDYIHASNAKLDFILNPKTNNISALFKPEDKSKSSNSAPMTFKVTDLHVDNSQLVYTDNTLNSPFKLPIKRIDFLAKNFDMNGNNDFKIKGSFPEGGTARFSWKGNMNDFSNQQIMMNLQNMSLKLMSPYCKYYTAYDITTGNMNFISKNNIRSNNITSSNTVDVYKMNVGKKQKQLKVKYNVPLRLALYIMKDKDDKINFDLPVKGNVKDPKFSYKKIIFKTIVNLMVKVALSPLKFLANSLGMNPDKMESIAIEPLQSGFTAEQYSQFNNLSTIIKKKPEMVLSLTQYVNLPDAMTEFALYKTKFSYLNSLQKSENNTVISNQDVQSVQNNDKDFVQYLDTLVKHNGMVSLQTTLQEKVNSLYSPDSLQVGLLNKLEKRNSYLKNYLMTSNEIPEKNLVIKTAQIDSLRMYKENAIYKIGMTLPGAEKPNE
ncbi:MAG: DUF748 domain-containing protein [Paludibacter sp.]|nr:DUF748 domain-containing protein [Paludibacter sp.]